MKLFHLPLFSSLSLILFTANTFGAERDVTDKTIDQLIVDKVENRLQITTVPPINSAECFYGLLQVNDLDSNASKTMVSTLLAAKMANREIRIQYNTDSMLCDIKVLFML